MHKKTHQVTNDMDVYLSSLGITHHVTFFILFVTKHVTPQKGLHVTYVIKRLSHVTFGCQYRLWWHGVLRYDVILGGRNYD